MAQYDLERRFGRHRHRLGRGRRHARQRALPEGRRGGAARGGQALRHRGLRQRRMELVPPARLAGQAHDLGQLAGRQGLPEPARLDLQDRGRHHDPLGGRVAALPAAGVSGADRIWRGRRRQPARLAADLRGDGPVLHQGRGQDGRHPHPRHPGPARQQQLQGDVQRRDPRRLQGRPHRPDGDQQPPARRPPGLPADRLLLPGLQVRRQVVDALHRDPEGRGDRQARPAAGIDGAADPARRCRQGHRRPVRRQGRQPAGAKGAGGLRRLQLDRDAATAVELGLGEVPGRPRQLLGPGRPQLHAPHHRLGLRDLRRAGADVSRHDHGRDHHGRVAATIRRAASSAATSWRPCRSACRSWRRSSSPAPGAATSPGRWRATPTWRGCGSSARTCRRSRTA